MASFREMKQGFAGKHVHLQGANVEIFLGLLKQCPSHVSEALVKSNNNESMYSLFFFLKESYSSKICIISTSILSILFPSISVIRHHEM